MKRLITLAAITLLISINANAAVVTNEDFNSGASGWSDNTTTSIGGNGVLGGYNAFGSGAEASKTFAITSGVSQIDIEFDFYRIDSWDGERFLLDVNGVNLVDDTYTLSGGTGDIAGAPFSDQVVHYSLSLELSASLLELVFSTTLDQGPSDESWAIDNLVISQTLSPVPLPAAVWFFLSAIGGLIGIRSQQRRS